MAKVQPDTRIRTCRSCGRKYEYPLKGDGSTRHHCEDCAVLPLETRKVMERLSLRIATLEARLKFFEQKHSA